MSKLSKDELIKKYSEKFSDDNDKKAEFLEDISDSFSDNSDETKAELEKVKAEAEQYKTESELYKQKYIDRFMTVDDKAPQPKPAPVEDLQEKSVIDIKEI